MQKHKSYENKKEENAVVIKKMKLKSEKFSKLHLCCDLNNFLQSHDSCQSTCESSRKDCESLIDVS